MSNLKDIDCMEINFHSLLTNHDVIIALINIILTKLTEYLLFEIISLLSTKNLIKIPEDNYKNYYFQN